VVVLLEGLTSTLRGRIPIEGSQCCADVDAEGATFGKSSTLHVSKREGRGVCEVVR